MKQIRDKATLSEKTVQKIALDNNTKAKTRTRRRVFNSQVQVKHWYDGVDPRIVAKIREMKIPPVFLEVKGSMEVIIHNMPVPPAKNGWSKKN